MSYAHHEEADFAASQLATMFVDDPTLCYRGVSSASVPAFSACASNEPGDSPWPLADGVISLVPTGNAAQQDVALEYKRDAEGVHGLLTAIGQSIAYLHKGYNGSVIVIPRRYASHARPAEHVKAILDASNVGDRIGVFDYEAPDKTSARPFHGRMQCVRPLTVGPVSAGVRPLVVRAKTQWAHLREGSTTRDCIFRYLQGAMRLSTGSHLGGGFDIDKRLLSAVHRLAPQADPLQYLSNTADDSLGSRVWRELWFNHLATKAVLTPYHKQGASYVVPGAVTGILKDDGSGFSGMFEGRTNGLKETVVARLNDGSLSEAEAWIAMVAGFQSSGTSGQGKQGARARAHSYREDVDSAVAQLQWIDSDGRPTDTGYRFVNICERYGGANSNAAKEYFAATLIQVGRYGSFLHYVHRLSEEMFGADPLAFTRRVGGVPVFTEDSYWEYLDKIRDHLVDELKVMRTVAGRGRPRERTLFQAELTFLRMYGFVAKERYRLGVGLPINWLRVHDAMEIEL